MIDTYVATAPQAGGLLKRTGAALALAGLFGLAMADSALAGGPFGGMDGSWTGSGTVSMDNGTKERMQCRAQYLVKDNDNNLQQSLTCNSPSYDLKVLTYVDHQGGGNLSGHWEEMKNNVRGNVSGTARGNQVRVLLRGAAFSATLSLVTRGATQSVVVTPGKESQSLFQRVAVTLRRSG